MWPPQLLQIVPGRFYLLPHHKTTMPSLDPFFAKHLEGLLMTLEMSMDQHSATVPQTTSLQGSVCLWKEAHPPFHTQVLKQYFTPQFQEITQMQPLSLLSALASLNAIPKWENIANPPVPTIGLSTSTRRNQQAFLHSTTPKVIFSLPLKVISLFLSKHSWLTFV